MSSTGGPSALDQITFKEMGLLSWLVVDLAINWAGWAVSAVLKTDKLFDMLGTGSFLVLSVASAAAAGARGALQALLVALPEFCECLDARALAAARGAGQESVAAEIELLLALRGDGPEAAAMPAVASCKAAAAAAACSRATTAGGVPAGAISPTQDRRS